jgi:hypothetical protein
MFLARTDSKPAVDINPIKSKLMSNERDNLVASARQAITNRFWESPLFRRVRSDALYHYAAALEGKALNGMMKGDLESANLGYFAAHRVAVESSARILPAILSRCRDEEGPINFSVEAYKEAEALIDLASDWDAIDYSFALATKEQWTFSVDPVHCRITFAYGSDEADEADTGLRSRELEVILSGERGRPDRAELTLLADQLHAELQKTVHTCGLERCSYEHTDELYRILNLISGELVKAVPQEMDATAQVDDLCFADLRKFWGALLALSQAQFFAHSIAMHANRLFPGRSMVLHKPRTELVAIISRITGLTSALVDKLIGLHVYDHHLYAPMYNSPTVQPLLPLNATEVCLPSPLINGNSFERNFFKLLNRHPSLRPFASAIESLKEPIAIKALNELFPKSRYRTGSNIKIPGVTDIDFAVYEIATGFALLIQHKWLAPPETGNESASNDEKLAAGVSQAQKSQTYTKEHPEFLQRALDMEKTEKINRVESVVVCRGFEQTAFMGHGVVPVIMEVAFTDLAKGSADRPGLWTKLGIRPDREDAATKVVDVMRTIQVGSYEFVLPYLGHL